MHNTFSATLWLMLFTLTVWSFHFLFMRKPTLAWPLFAFEWYSRWPLCKVVKHSSRLLTFSIPIKSYANLVSLNSFSTSCMCSSLSRVLTLYDPEILHPARSPSWPEPPPLLQGLSAPLGSGGHSFVILCMLVLLAMQFGLEGVGDNGWTKLPKFRPGPSSRESGTGHRAL